MELKTLTDKGTTRVVIDKAFTSADGRLFLVLRRTVPYASKRPVFLGEVSTEVVRKRLADGGEQVHYKLFVRQSVSEQEIEFLRGKDAGAHGLPLLGMKSLKALVGGGKLTFLLPSAYEKMLGDREFKLVGA